jgi:hypothetical protein
VKRSDSFVHAVQMYSYGMRPSIVTMNLDDFPESALAPYSIEAQHPDIFVNLLLDLEPEVVCHELRLQRKSLLRPPSSVDDFLRALGTAGLHQTAVRLRSEFQAYLYD